MAVSSERIVELGSVLEPTGHSADGAWTVAWCPLVLDLSGSVEIMSLTVLRVHRLHQLQCKVIEDRVGPTL